MAGEFRRWERPSTSCVHETLARQGLFSPAVAGSGGGRLNTGQRPCRIPPWSPLRPAQRRTSPRVVRRRPPAATPPAGRLGTASLPIPRHPVTSPVRRGASRTRDRDETRSAGERRARVGGGSVAGVWGRATDRSVWWWHPVAGGKWWAAGFSSEFSALRGTVATGARRAVSVTVADLCEDLMKGV